MRATSPNRNSCQSISPDSVGCFRLIRPLDMRHSRHRHIPQIACWRDSFRLAHQSSVGPLTTVSVGFSPAPRLPMTSKLQSPSSGDLRPWYPLDTLYPFILNIEHHFPCLISVGIDYFYFLSYHSPRKELGAYRPPSCTLSVAHTGQILGISFGPSLGVLSLFLMPLHVVAHRWRCIPKVHAVDAVF